MKRLYFVSLGLSIFITLLGLLGNLNSKSNPQTEVTFALISIAGAAFLCLNINVGFLILLIKLIHNQLSPKAMKILIGAGLVVALLGILWRFIPGVFERGITITPILIAIGLMTAVITFAKLSTYQNSPKP